MMQCGVIHGTADRTSGARVTGPITPVHDLNVPYEATEEYETPTAEMLFPPVSNHIIHVMVLNELPLCHSSESVSYRNLPPNKSSRTSTLQCKKYLKSTCTCVCSLQYVI